MTIGKNEGRRELYEDTVIEGSTRDPELVTLTKDFIAALNDEDSDYPDIGAELRL